MYISDNQTETTSQDCYTKLYQRLGGTLRSNENKWFDLDTRDLVRMPNDVFNRGIPIAAKIQANLETYNPTQPDGGHYEARLLGSVCGVRYKV